MNANRRKYLVDSFHETVHQLESAYSLQHQGRSVGELLIHSISMHADEGTLEAIQADLRAELDHVGLSANRNGGAASNGGTAVETRPRTRENSHVH